MFNCFCPTVYPVSYAVRKFISCKSESITAVHVRDHSAAMIYSVQKCNWLCCNVGCHVFRNRQRIIWWC